MIRRHWPLLLLAAILLAAWVNAFYAVWTDQ